MIDLVTPALSRPGPAAADRAADKPELTAARSASCAPDGAGGGEDRDVATGGTEPDMADVRAAMREAAFRALL